MNNTTDGMKIAAAVLAAEASRQKIELNGTAKTGRDIPGEIMSYYAHFLRAVAYTEEPLKG